MALTKYLSGQKLSAWKDFWLAAHIAFQISSSIYYQHIYKTAIIFFGIGKEFFVCEKKGAEFSILMGVADENVPVNSRKKYKTKTYKRTKYEKHRTYETYKMYKAQNTQNAQNAQN